MGLPPDPEGVQEGLDTLQEILKLAPYTKVIVVTGNGDQENALKSVALGAYDFYQKPVETDTLRLFVDRAFSMGELEAENRQLQNLASEPICSVIRRLFSAAETPVMTSCSLCLASRSRLNSAHSTATSSGVTTRAKPTRMRPLRDLGRRNFMLKVYHCTVAGGQAAQ